MATLPYTVGPRAGGVDGQTCNKSTPVQATAELGHTLNTLPPDLPIYQVWKGPQSTSSLSAKHSTSHKGNTFNHPNFPQAHFSLS